MAILILTLSSWARASFTRANLGSAVIFHAGLLRSVLAGPSGAAKLL